MLSSEYIALIFFFCLELIKNVFLSSGFVARDYYQRTVVILRRARQRSGELFNFLLLLFIVLLNQ